MAYEITFKSIGITVWSILLKLGRNAADLAIWARLPAARGLVARRRRKTIAGWETTAAVVQFYAGGAMHDSAATVLASLPPAFDRPHTPIEPALLHQAGGLRRQVSPDLTRDPDPWRKAAEQAAGYRARGVVGLDVSARIISRGLRCACCAESREHGKPTVSITHPASQPSSSSSTKPHTSYCYLLVALAGGCCSTLQEPRV